jgi:hypothetical protein
VIDKKGPSMAAKRQTAQQRRWAAPARSRPIPATEQHESIASPAALLQAQLGAAIGGPWADQHTAPDPGRWSGAVRVLILLGGAIGSWALVLGALRHLF